MDYRIRGFGACMIGGFPHRPEESFFNYAVEKLRKETTHNLIPSQFVLEGFPITRAKKYLESKCLATNPDIVVAQFAASDLIVSIRSWYNRRLNSTVKSSSFRVGPRIMSANPPTRFDRLRWLFQGAVGDVMRMAPVTPPEIFVESMTQFTRALLEHQVVPVILSPFVFGGLRSDRIARDCANRLRQAVVTMPKAVFVDAYAALDRHPRSLMLLADGMHLSLEGHKVVGEALFLRLKDIVDKHELQKLNP